MKNKETASQPIAEDKTTCNAAEQVRNGQPINWQYWQSIKAITPLQGAKLAHCIDPIKWPDDCHAQGPLRPDLREKIERLSVWLADKGEKWTLAKLVKVLGRNAPFNMREGAEEGQSRARAKVSPPSTNWKMQVQAEAAKRWIALRESGASPTKLGINPDLVKWCADNKIKTATGVAVTAENLYKFALLPWTPPDDSEVRKVRKRKSG